MTAPHFINQPLLEIARRDDAIIMHPHAQRTGGNSLRMLVFEKLFSEQQIYGRRYNDAAKPWPKLTDADVEGIRAYTDLENFKPIKLTRPYVGLTMLRHPLYRAISLYNLVRSKPEHRHYELAMRAPLEEFYRRASEENPDYFQNLQCRRICRRADAKLAVETLKEHFVGVGFTSRLPSFVSEIGEALGWPEMRLRAVPPDEERYAAVVTPALRDMVLDQNREDLALVETMEKGPPYAPPPRSWNANMGRVTERARWLVRRVSGKAL